MRKINEVLRLHFEHQLGQRQIGRAIDASQSTVHDYLARFTAAGADSERWRSAFRSDGDRDSEFMPITIPS